MRPTGHTVCHSAIRVACNVICLNSVVTAECGKKNKINKVHYLLVVHFRHYSHTALDVLCYSPFLISVLCHSSSARQMSYCTGL